MANVIQSLTVGLGFEVDKKSVSNVESSFDGLASKAKMLGTVMAGAFGVKKLAFDYADMVDGIGKFAGANDLAASDILAFGGALEKNGGSVQEFIGTLDQLTKQKDAFKEIGIDGGIFGELARVNVDMGEVFDAGDAIEQYKKLTDIIGGLSAGKQRVAVDLLGMGQADLLTFKGGVVALEMEADYQKTLRDISKQDTVNSAKFNDAVQELGKSIGGLTDVISTDLVLPLAEGMRALTGAIVDIKGVFSDDDEPDDEYIPSGMRRQAARRTRANRTSPTDAQIALDKKLGEFRFFPDREDGGRTRGGRVIRQSEFAPQRASTGGQYSRRRSATPIQVTVHSEINMDGDKFGSAVGSHLVGVIEQAGEDNKSSVE